MTAYDQAIDKIQHLPEPLLQEVNDFIDFVQMRQNQRRWQSWQLFQNALDMAESDMSDYLTNLQDYENRLAKGEIAW